MIEILEEAEKKKKARAGKPNALAMEKRLLITLEYLRECRTYFHFASSYGISENTGRKELRKSDMDYEVVLIDATETPIERPKKEKIYIKNSICRE